MKPEFLRRVCWLLLLVCITASSAQAQMSAFTYQGKLNEGGIPANSAYDIQFKLFDASGDGNQIGTTQTITNVQTTAGIFTVQLDFGAAAFSGTERWVEIAISPAGQNNFTTLAPRQELTSAPYSIQSLNAVDSLNLGGIPAGQYVQTNDSRLSDARIPLPGSGHYVQNTDVPQPGVNFNIGGIGTANILNAATQFDLAGNRVLGIPGAGNLVVGPNSGWSLITPGSQNSFFGHNAGRLSTTAQFNTFLGNNSGELNTTGSRNVFAGYGAGLNNITGGENSFFGVLAGLSNSTGTLNTFIGKEAGNAYTTGSRNTFVGAQSGQPNTEVRNGNNNTALGYQAWVGNGLAFSTAIGSGAESTANDTIVIGKKAGTYNGIARPADRVEVPGDLNIAGSFGASILNATTQFNLGGQRILAVTGTGTFLNTFAGVGAGSNNTSGQSNSFFGQNAGLNNTTGSANAFFGTDAGRDNAGNQNSFFGGGAGFSNRGFGNSFFGFGTGFQNTTGERNAFFGDSAGASNNAGGGNSFFGASAGLSNTSGLANTFIGAATGGVNTTGRDNTIIGAFANVGANNLINATAIGAFAVVNTSDTIVIGKPTGNYRGVARPADTVQIPGVLNVAGARILNDSVNSNLFVGVNAGGANTTGFSNAFFGRLSGASNTTGGQNAFFGQGAGHGNTIQNGNSYFGHNAGGSATGSSNSFFGESTGLLTTGNLNSFFGYGAGNNNTAGEQNSFFGTYAGIGNVTGISNSFFGESAGLRNTTGSGNTFVGHHAGRANQTGTSNTLLGGSAGRENTGNFNVFIGYDAARRNITGSNNLIVGAFANVGADDLTNAIAIGHRAQVAQSNSLVLGGINLVNGATADTNVGIGTPAPQARLDVRNGNILVGSPGQGIILRSPDGSTCGLLSIDNTGALVTSAVACP